MQRIACVQATSRSIGARGSDSTEITTTLIRFTKSQAEELNMKKLIYTLAIAGMVMAGTAASTFGQGTYLVPDGDEITCTVVCEGQVEVFAYDPDNDPVPITTNGFGSGDASFTCISTRRTPLATASFQASSMTLTGTNPQFGAFSFSFDRTRPARATTVTEIVAGTLFPATINVNANVTGRIAGLPGGTYINRNLCQMTATINTFNPQSSEAYSFVNDVEFIDANGGPNAPTAFRIPAGTAVWMN
jgi:hypothetical protein